MLITMPTIPARNAVMGLSTLFPGGIMAAQAAKSSSTSTQIKYPSLRTAFLNMPRKMRSSAAERCSFGSVVSSQLNMGSM